MIAYGITKRAPENSQKLSPGALFQLTAFGSQHVKDNRISQVEKSLKKLTYGAPHIFTELEKTDIYLVASKLEGRD